MISWIVRKYNKTITEVKSNLPEKKEWIVKVRLIDGSEVNLAYKAHSIPHVKQLYDMDMRVYNGLIVGERVSKKYIGKRYVARMIDIMLIDSGAVVHGEESGEYS